MPKIYKYFSHDVLNHVFARDNCCGLKFSLPKDYNDPFELFLALDLTVPSDYLATYSDIVQHIPQFPTTCFSKSPIVTPMWAHYANNHTGFALEFDTDRIKEQFPNSVLKGVTYLEKPSTNLHDLLEKAAVAAKPRHASWLRDAAQSTAYFSKYKEWAYEQEKRMVVGQNDTEDVGGHQILFLPIDCVSAILLGQNFPKELMPSVTAVIEKTGIGFYKIEIGRSFPVPYLVDGSENVYVYEENEIRCSDRICESCSEPLTEDAEQCPWCRITEVQKYEAGMKNPFRILDYFGVLEGYLEDVEKMKRRK